MENPNENPYAAPKATLTTPLEQDTLLLLEPEKRPAGAAWDWFSNAWQLFKAAPMLWIGIVFAYWITYIISSYIPLLNMVFPFLSLVFIGGMALGCHALANNEPLEFSHLFAGFKGENWLHLVIVSVLSMLLTFLALIPGLLIIGASFIPLLMGNGDFGSAMQGLSFVSMGVGALVMFLGVIAASMTYWFAPALVAIHNLTAIEAMKLSFKGCLKNIVPFFLYWFIGLLLSIVAAIPLFLGFIVLLPVFMITYYTSYRDVLTKVD